MQKLNDELLVAYLDGELDDKQQADVEARLEEDAAARDRLTRLGESTALVRAAFDELLREEVPQHLIAAIHKADPAAGNEPEDGRGAQILPFRMRQAARGLAPYRRWWIAVPVAASLFGIMIGGGLGYLGLGSTKSGEQQVAIQNAATNGWLDNVAEFHKLFVSAPGENSFADIPANENGGEVLQKISQRTAQQNLRVPDLKPWGLVFQGARLVVVEGRSAAQLVYTADNKTVGKAIGPLTVLIGLTKRPDISPTFEHRQDVNMLYWRRKGHVYVIVGQADSGYMWGLANDVEWQLNGI